MKRTITKSLILLFGLVALSSCENDDIEDRPVVTAIDAPVLEAPTANSSYVLSIENASMQAERFVWSSANFDQDVAITYTVEIDSLGNDFADPQSLGSTISQNQLSVSVESLNGAVLLAGGEPFVNGQYEVRVKASVNSTFEAMYSEPLTISVTPYVAVVPPLYLVGAPQAYYGTGAWQPENGIPMRYIGDGVTRIYEAYVKVAAGEGFKFTGGLNWDNGNYGTIGGSQNGNLENGGGSGDIKVAESTGSGLYYVWVDIDNLKYRAVKMNWGMIGDATPGAWANETPMTYNFDTNTFSITTALTAGELKFRSRNTGMEISNSEWQFNVGNSDPTVVYNPSAGNFAVAAGTYTLNLSVNFDGTATVEGL